LKGGKNEIFSYLVPNSFIYFNSLCIISAVGIPV